MKKSIIAALMALLAISMASAQKTPAPQSAKQDLAIFALGYHGWDIPKSALGEIDAQIQKNFLDLGRFKIIGMTHRLASTDIEAFIAKITEAKEENFVLPAAIKFGDVQLTKAEFNKIIKAYIVAIPVVNKLEVARQKDGELRASLSVSISFVDVASNTLVGIANIKTSGKDSKRDDAIAKAISSIPMNMQYEVRKIEQFRNKTTISKVTGSEIIIGVGANLGVKMGDEYAILETKTIAGSEDQVETGLAIIKEVGKEASTATVIIPSAKIEEAVPVAEIARLGVDLDVFFKALIGYGSSFTSGDIALDGDVVTPILGVKVTYSRGFYALRPFTVIQIPLNTFHSGDSWSYGHWTASLVNWMVGAEYNIYMNRLTLAPAAAIGLGGYNFTPEYGSSKTSLSHIGLYLGGKASWHITRDIKINGEVGYEHWIEAGDYYGSYGGLAVAVSGTYKF